ncbi:MAG: hypothetical protein WCY87_05690 [Candidatus Cloacimonadales bacterium]|jgi:hypothetical protein|nr:hypothetical protein [Candidatus Cloacimonadota bacterium]MDY0380697.1 hypothetical protein [Candidatus Cloacimonadaceae bacterium]MCB5264522.1 hypothetical protein [Candidatus Cloacimonadota bacterium]MCB5276465.1 hypothetical protein [Candidatus Cloacimonadota bacterium]MCK9433507.1 hypothetical protein [Candidatus Cloacimonadota bacterium]
MRRLTFASILFGIWSLAFAVIWFHNVALQTICLVTLIVLTLLVLGSKKLIQELRLLLPFIAMLIVVYAIFILLGIDPEGKGALQYWINYGLPRALLLVNAVLAFRLCFAFVSVDKLLSSGAGIHRLKYLILGKILYEAAANSYHQLKYWQELIPTVRTQDNKGLKDRFKTGLSSTLALILYIMAEAKYKGERIDNLIATCHKENR